MNTMVQVASERPHVVFRADISLSLFSLLALAQASGKLINRRLLRQFVLLAILVIDIQPPGKLLQYSQRPRRLPFREQINLKFETISFLQNAVGRILANEDTGGEKYRLQREECPEQREREWIKRAVREEPAESNPAHHRRALQHNKLRSARERSDCMKNTMMKSDLFLILLFKPQDSVDIF